MKEEDLVLKDIELCKKVRPIMGRLGIEPDGLFYGKDSHEYFRLIVEMRSSSPNNAYSYSLGYQDTLRALNLDPRMATPTYRQDKLAMALPDWAQFLSTCLNDKEIFKQSVRTHTKGFYTTRLYDLMLDIHGRGFTRKLLSTAELLELLEDNGLGKGVDFDPVKNKEGE